MKFGMKDVLDANGVATGEQIPYGLNFTWLSRIGTAYYFAYFVLILPILGLIEKPKDRPESITHAILGDKSHGTPAVAE